MPDENSAKNGPRHSLADHSMGSDFAHVHEGVSDHDHDHFDDDPGALEDNPIWIADHVTLRSVGIDIGSSGTQVIFSKINLRRHGEDLSSRYVVVSRETLFQSAVALTPYHDQERIDEIELGRIIDDAYAAAGIAPGEIDTGAVILTGEALRRDNAKMIAGVVAEHGGDFVCATAGHHMESMLAAYGSGAAAASHQRGETLLNIDIGGGTTKLALVTNGRAGATAAIHIGGRLQVVDGDGRITRLDPAGFYHAERAGFHWHLGDTASSDALDRVAGGMADTLIACLTGRADPATVEALTLTQPLGDLSDVRGIMMSGGVAEYVYAREDRDFGDMGRRLGVALRQRIDAGALPWPLLPAGECIRATALGASEYSIQLSGNTTYVSDPATLLPQRNLQVVVPSFNCGGDIDAAALARAIQERREAFDLADSDKPFALAMHWGGLPAYERIAAFAQGLRDGLADVIAARRPLFIMLDSDIAQTLGAILREELSIASEILVVDGVTLWDFDYIDLGRIRMPSRTIPVSIKSLVFNEDPRGASPPQRLHHRQGHHHGEGHAHHGHDHAHGGAHHHDGHDHHHDGEVARLGDSGPAI